MAGAIETEDPRTVGPKKPGRKRKEPATPDESLNATPVKRSSRLAEQKENVPPHPAASEAEQDAVFNNVLNSSAGSQQPPEQPQQQPGEFENMGYDQNSTAQLSNLGYDQGAPTPGGPASMGAPTPYRYDYLDTLEIFLANFQFYDFAGTMTTTIPTLLPA